MSRFDRTLGGPDDRRAPVPPSAYGPSPRDAGLSPPGWGVGASGDGPGLIGRLEDVAAALVRGGARPEDHSAWEDAHLWSLGAAAPGLLTDDHEADDGPPPEAIGKYRVIRELGRGGFGVVYQAHDPDLQRDVAVKVPLPGLIASASVRRWFVREALAVAVLDHPNIVQVYDADVVGPVAYIVSACCTGPSLAAWLRDQVEPVPPRVAAALLKWLARGVEHAHRRGILHRDLKPANVVLQPGGDPEAAGMTPRLTDFGLARLADEAAGDQTRTGMVIGSAPYMAPEQVAARHGEVGPATDVYALGVTLYEVLVGAPPFAGGTRAETWLEVLSAEPVPLRDHRPDVPRDLQTICLRAFHKDPAGRYPTAGALADDLERFLDGEPIHARPESLAARYWRRARRHPAPAAVLAVGTVAVVLAGLIIAWAAVRARVEAELAVSRAAEVARHRHAARLIKAREVIEAGQPERAQEILDASDEAGPPRRDFAWRYLWDQARRDLAVWGRHDARICRLALTLDDATLATSDRAGTVRLWDVATGRPRAEFCERAGTAEQLAFSPDGSTLAVAGGPTDSGDAASVVTLRAVADRRVLTRLRIPGATGVFRLGFAADGRTLLVGADRGDGVWAVRSWDLGNLVGRGAAPSPRLVLDGPDAAHFAPDGRWIWTIDRDGQMRRFDPSTGRADRVIRLGDGERGLVAVSPDGRYLATLGVSQVLNVRDLRADGPPRAVFAGVVSPSDLLFSPDSATLLLVAGGLHARLIPMAGGPVVEVTPHVPGREGRFEFVFTPDGRSLSARGGYQPGGRQPLTLYEVATGRPVATSPGRLNVHLTLFDHAGRTLIQVSDFDVAAWRPFGPASMPVERLEGHLDEVWSVAIPPGGRVLASGGEDHRIRLWDLRSQARPGTVFEAHDATVGALAWHPGGQILASGSLGTSENLKLWDASGRLIRTLPGHTRQVRAVAFSTDGSILASAGSDRTILLWDGTTGAPRGRLDGHEDVVRGLAFAPDGRRLASASNDKTVRIWNLDHRQSESVFAEEHQVVAVAFAADGLLLASADEGGVVRFRDPASGATARVVFSDDREIRALAFAPDGNTLAAAGKFGSIRVWDPATGQPLLELKGATATQINALAFAPDGATLVAADHGGHALIYRAPHPPPPRDAPRVR